MKLQWKLPSFDDGDENEVASCDIDLVTLDARRPLLVGYVSDLDKCRGASPDTYMGRVLARAERIGVTQRFLISWRRDEDDAWKETGADTLEEAQRLCEVYVALEQ